MEETTKNTPGKTKHSLLASLIAGVLIFMILCASGEAVSRTGWFTNHFLIRSLGNYHSQFEIKWFKLQDYVRENGGVDVIILGSSMVNTGIDPDILASEYEKTTGQHLRIFNFGVEGLTVSPVSELAQILVKQYHPGTILLVTEMRDYVAANGLDTEQQFLSDPWIETQLGDSRSLSVQLKSSSVLIQHLLPFRNWSRYDFLDNFLSVIKRTADTARNGYEPDRKVGKNIEVPPDPNDPEEKANFELYKSFSIDPGRLEDLGSVLSFSSLGTKVFVTEMPVYPTYFAYFGGEAVHKAYLDDLEGFITANGGALLLPASWEMIPLSGRADNHHLNFKGAPKYSSLLAAQLSAVCLQDNRCLQAAAELKAAK